MLGPRLRDFIEAHTRKTPDATALVAPGRSAISYATLLDHLTTTGRRLRSLGVNRRDRVALVIPDGPEALTAFLVVSDQATAAPVNPAYRQSEYETYFTTVGVTALVTALTAGSPADAAARSLGLPIIRLVIAEAQPAGMFTLDGPERAPALDGDDEPDVALILTTSGTTSRPKVVPLTHANLCNSAANIAASLDLTASDRCFGIMPLFHVHGLVGGALASLTAGGSVICPPGFDAPRFFPILDELKPTWYTGAPTLHQAIVARVDRHRDVVDRSRLRVIRSCSAALPPVTREALEAAFRAPVVEAYGMTEAAHQMTSTPLPVDPAKAGSVGVSTGTAVAILDATGEPLATGQVGEIAVRGPSVTAGYEGAPAANAQAFVNGWFRTGDEGRLDEDGFLFITGRLKEIINRGGEKVSPPEVDQELLAHPAVAQAFAFSMPDPRLGETVAAVVVLKPGAACTERELREFAASRLATFKVPDRVVFVDEVPKTATGKVQRIGMADRLGLNGAVAPAPKASPAAGTKTSGSTLTFVHRIVAAIWCDVLGLDEVGPDQPFFEVGGDSILAAQVLARVREMLRVDVSVIAFFDEPTVAGLVGNIARAAPAPAATASTDATIRLERAPLSSAQQRLWFLDQWAPGNPAYHDYAAWRVTGPLDTATLERSLNALLQRHDLLRTSFPHTDGRPEQIIAPACTVTIDRRDISTMPRVAREPEAIRLVADYIQRPFDLTKAPLVRCLVVRVSEPNEAIDRAVHVVVVVLHHLVCDGWSMAVLQRELAAFYSAFRDDRSPELARLPIQYADHAVAEVEWLQSPRCGDQMAYWQTQLAEAPLLDLPTDRPRPPVQGTSSGNRSRVLSAELCDGLRAVARSEGATMFMLFVAAFNVVLARNARQEDVVIGTPIAGRRTVDTEALIGPFANTLAIRTDVSGDPAFRELLARVRRVTLEANTHQDLPFEKIVEALGGVRRLDRAPLFQVFFNYRNLPPRPTPFPGLDVEPFPVDLPAAIADLSLEIVDRGAAASAGEMRCQLDYDAELFDAETIDQLLDQFEHLLERISADPGRRLSELTMMSPAMRDQILVSWNDTATPFEPRCIHQLVQAQVDRTPELIAVRCGDLQISYRDLNARANRLARVLAAAGAAVGTRVGIAVAPSVETVVAILAVLKTGAAYVALDPLQPRERLAFVHKDADLVALVTERRLIGTIPRGAVPVICVDDDLGPVDPDADGNLGLACSPEQLFCIIFTSGSTGVPKGVMLAHRAVCNRLSWARDALPLDENDRVLLASSIAFDSSIIEIFEPLTIGAQVVVAPSGMLDPAAIVRMTQAYGVTVIALVPALLEALTADPEFRACHSVRRITCGGEVLSAALARSTLSRLDLALSNCYGPAEACCDVTWWHMTRTSLATMDDRPVPIGRPIANARAYVLDPNGQPVPVGVPGELYLGGECLANGYWRRPDLTEAVFVPDPFATHVGSRLYRTGDLVRYRSHGVLDFLGRVDDQMKIRGVRIEPQEVVTALRQHPAIRDAAVVADRARTRLLAYLVAAPPAPSEAELRQHLRDRVPDAMIPSVFVVVDALPRTVSGKIDRRALPEVEAARAAERAAFAPADTPMQAALAEIWQSVLHVEGIGIDDDFFALGGHSLMAAQVAARVHARLAVTVPIRQLFETPTVRRLAAALETAPAAPPRPPIARADRAAYRRAIGPSGEPA